MAKQIIVMRKDLKMKSGKMCSQAAHASMKVFFDLDQSDEPNRLEIKLDKHMKEWVRGAFTKICVGVDSEEQLYAVYNQAKELSLPCSLIIDAGHTVFHGEPTATCVAIGPASDALIDLVTGDLKLL